MTPSSNESNKAIQNQSSDLKTDLRELHVNHVNEEIQTVDCINLAFESQNKPQPNFEHVVISKSNNVQFGNSLHFNGPVVIKEVYNNGRDPTSEPVIDVGNSKEIPQNDSNKMWNKIRNSLMCILLSAFLCAIGIKILDIYFEQSQFIDSDDDWHIIPDGNLKMVTRTEWLAQPPSEKLDPLFRPAPWVIITHTAMESCHTQSKCVLMVRLIQTFHMESRGWSDIGYNFLVGGDGLAYFGRGWDYIGAHTLGYNNISIGIAFIGTFNTENPTPQQIHTCKKLIEQGVNNGKLSKDYELFGHRQLQPTLSPGDALFAIIEKWPHFAHKVKNVSFMVP